MSVGGVPTATMTRILCVAVAVLLCATTAHLAAAERAYQPAYRAAQFTVSSEEFGPRGHVAKGRATRYLRSRGVLVVAWHEFMSLKSLNDVKSEAVVVVMPSEQQREADQYVQQQWATLQRRLLATTTKKAIYFVDETKELREILDAHPDLQEKQTGSIALSMLMKGGYRVKIETGEPRSSDALSASAKSSPSLLVEFRGSAETPKTILVVTHYDSFSAIPALTRGDWATTVVAEQLLSQLTHLYSDSNTIITMKHNLKFLFVGGAPLGYAGAAAWLDKHAPLDGVEFVLCLDSLAPPPFVNRVNEGADADDGEEETSAPALYAHVSKPPTDGSPISLFFTQLAEHSVTGGRINGAEVVHRKINRAVPIKSWPHEVFRLHPTRPRAFTLSSISSAGAVGEPFPFSEYSSSSSAADVQELAQTATIILKSLAHFAADLALADYAVARDVYDLCTVEASALETRLGARLEQGPSAILPFNTSAATALVKDIAKSVKGKSGSVRVSSDAVDLSAAMVSLYLDESAEMVLSSVTGALKDFFVFLGVVIYITVLYAILSRVFGGERERKEA